MPTPQVIVLSGYGLNSELETLQGFLHCGAQGEVVHINDLIDGRKKLADYQIMAIPGGFSFGDDTGSGNAYANRVRNNIWEQVREFVQADKLAIGICNGAQVGANLGLAPALNNAYGERQIALRHNATARYECRWVDIKINQANNCVWTKGIDTMHIVVSHGEGNFYADPKVLKQLEDKNLIAAQYVKPAHPPSPLDSLGATEDKQLYAQSLKLTADSFAPANGEFPYNPNGAQLDMAAISDECGRILLIMPHPERAMFFTQRDDWPLFKEKNLRAGEEIPIETDGMHIFRNAVEYFS
ncbi:MAG TPA: phosphoribosylformylglycinamidine synthase subunit PurQ [bacterium]|nr:phosphoribosylformylglycinamidine synthase subunit PurQ [bacterium]